jgi:hypothetical protein
VEAGSLKELNDQWKSTVVKDCDVYLEVKKGGNTMQSGIIREAQIKKVKQSLSITDGEIFMCRLSNDQVSSLHGDEDTSICILSHIPNETMDLLVAYLQSLGAEVDEEFPLIQDDIAQLLIQFYNCEIIEIDQVETAVQIHSLELNEHWDTWTGYYVEINEIPLFKRDGLYEAIQSLG